MSTKALILFLGVFLVVLKCNGATPICDLFEDISRGNISEGCLKQMHTVCNDPELSWKMFDASTKFLISGMTYSNVMDYGNFPECMSIEHEDANGTILGKHCLYGQLIVNVFLTPDTQKILHHFNIDVNIPKHFISLEIFKEIEKETRDLLLPEIPYVISKSSVCIPDACTPREVGHFYLYGHLDVLSLIIYTDLPCQTKEANTILEAKDIAVIVFLATVVGLMIANSAYDKYCEYSERKPYHEILIAFSIFYNGKKLMATSNNKTEQIQIFNGMRFIGTMWVVAYHAVAPLEAGIVPLENYPAAREWYNSWYGQYILGALLAVDTFFFMTAFLVSYSYIKKFCDVPFLKQLSKVPMMILHRYLRLTPAIAAIFLITITVYRFLGQGPMWEVINNAMATDCRNHWWQFFLYIQNYTNPNNLCILQLWYLSADMQLFVLTPLVLIPTALYIKKYFKQVMWTLCGLTILCIIGPMLVRYYQYQSAGNVYTAHDRFPNLVMGLTFGAIMRLIKDKPFIFSPIVNLLLWVIGLVVSLFIIIYWHSLIVDYELVKYTLFMGFYRPIWCTFLCFMVYSCYHNHGGVIQWFLSRKIFQILGKISYCMYVVHASVELYSAGTSTVPGVYSDYSIFYHWCGHFIMTMVVSVIWVLAFEFPMITIDKYLTAGALAGQKEKLTKA